jgi:hypothetical protein
MLELPLKNSNLLLYKLFINSYSLLKTRPNLLIIIFLDFSNNLEKLIQNDII